MFVSHLVLVWSAASDRQKHCQDTNEKPGVVTSRSRGPALTNIGLSPSGISQAFQTQNREKGGEIQRLESFDGLHWTWEMSAAPLGHRTGALPQEVGTFKRSLLFVHAPSG